MHGLTKAVVTDRAHGSKRRVGGVWAWRRGRRGGGDSQRGTQRVQLALEGFAVPLLVEPRLARRVRLVG